MRFALPLFALIAISCPSLAEDEPAGKPRPPEKKLEGSETPQACFDAVKASAGKKDWGAFHDQVDPEDRNVAIFALLFLAAFATMGDDDAAKEFEGLMKKHGVPEKKEGAEPLPMNDKEKLKEAAKEMFKDVKDKRALFADILAFTESRQKEGENDGFMITEKTELTGLKEEGEVATGTLKGTKDDEEKPIKFVKRESRWYLAFGE
jgi:HEAT repeat protein